MYCVIFQLSTCDGYLYERASNLQVGIIDQDMSHSILSILHEYDLINYDKEIAVRYFYDHMRDTFMLSLRCPDFTKGLYSTLEGAQICVIQLQEDISRDIIDAITLPIAKMLIRNYLEYKLESVFK